MWQIPPHLHWSMICVGSERRTLERTSFCFHPSATLFSNGASVILHWFFNFMVQFIEMRCINHVIAVSKHQVARIKPKGGRGTERPFPHSLEFYAHNLSSSNRKNYSSIFVSHGFSANDDWKTLLYYSFGLRYQWMACLGWVANLCKFAIFSLDIYTIWHTGLKFQGIVSKDFFSNNCDKNIKILILWDGNFFGSKWTFYIAFFASFYCSQIGENNIILIRKNLIFCVGHFFSQPSWKFACFIDGMTFSFFSNVLIISLGFHFLSNLFNLLK